MNILSTFQNKKHKGSFVITETPAESSVDYDKCKCRCHVKNVRCEEPKACCVFCSSCLINVAMDKIIHHTACHGNCHKATGQKVQDSHACQCEKCACGVHVDMRHLQLHKFWCDASQPSPSLEETGAKQRDPDHQNLIL